MAENSKLLTVGLIGANSALCKAFINMYSQRFIFNCYYGKTTEPKKTQNHVHHFEKYWWNHIKENDYIIVFAAKIPTKQSPFFVKLKYFFSNIQIALKTAFYSKNSKIIFCSSVSVYNDNANYITPATWAIPSTLYGLSKLISEKILLVKGATSIRWTSIFGVGTKNHSLVNFFKKSADKGIIKLYGNPDRVQDYISTTRASKLLHTVLTLHQKGVLTKKVLIGASYQSLTNFQLATLIVSYYQEEKNIKVDLHIEKNLESGLNRTYSKDFLVGITGFDNFNISDDIKEYLDNEI